MKLFLSSLAISYEQGPAFIKLVGKPAKDIKIALIENAADGESGDKPWVDDNRIAIQALGLKVDVVDLENYRDGVRKEPLLQTLKNYDVVWLGGGNTYYLRWILKETRADIIIKGLVKKGMVYGGGSAGATMAGPTLKYFNAADDSSVPPELLTDGLGLINTVVLPHWGNEKFGNIMRNIADQLKKAGYTTKNITDEQALVINGSNQTIVP